MLVSVPPRHSKTETVLHAIAYQLARDPKTRIGYCTYSASLARAKSRLAQGYALNSGVTLSSRAASRWETTAGGFVLAVGIGGSLTGEGLDLLIVDDPFKNREQAESPLIRAKVYDWLSSTANTRLEPNGAAFVLHTRWHTDDLIGRLIKEEKGYDVLNLPAISQEGKALWPSRWSVEELLRKQSQDITDYDWQSLYLGNPRPKEGLVFKRLESRHIVPHSKLVEQFKLGGRGWKFRVHAGKDFGHTDPGCLIWGGVTGDGVLVILGEVYASGILYDGEGWVRIVREASSAHNISTIAADPSGAGNIRLLRKGLDGSAVVIGADNSITDGLNAINSYLQRTRADGSPCVLISDACKNLVREMQSYQYASGSELPLPGKDHAIDALRYLVRSFNR
jgi:hypothetical protein